MKKVSFLFCLVCLPVFAQEKINFISYEELGNQIYEYKEEGDFEKALELINQIHPNDSIYCSSLTSKSYYLLNLDRVDEALEVTEEGIKMDCDKESKMYFYVNTGYAYNKLERYEDALELYTNALKEFPKSATLWYNKGVVYKESKQPEKAIACFIKSIKYQPTNSNAHFNMGSILYEQEESSLGLMALSMSVFATPDEASSLNKLTTLNNTFATKNANQVTAKNIDPDQGSFKQLDLILDNLVAVDEDYEIDNKIPIPLVKQLHVFFEQMDDYKGNGGFWDQAYLPFFRWVKENDYFDEFVYLILYSNTNEDFQKIIEKENKEIVAFAEVAYPKWYDIIRKLNTELEAVDNAEAIYTYGEGHVYGFGLATEEVPVGEWHYYSDSGYQISEGEYSQDGDKIGLWQYYNAYGALNEKNLYTEEKGNEDDETLEITGFYSNGNVNFTYPMKNDEPNGKYVSYTYYGGLKQNKMFVDGKLQGPYAAYFDTGKTHIEFETNYVDGEIDGELIEYYSNGEVYSIMNYENGVQNGKEIRYARNGQKSFEVNVVDGSADGVYNTYHVNGQISETGNMDNGLSVGQWQNFDDKGKLISTYNYNEKGELDGEYIVYEDEKKQIEYTYRNGEIIAYSCYDPQGGELISKKKKKGKFYFKSFYLNGNQSTEGEYDVEGGKIGVWKEYYPTGTLQVEGTYKENNQVGEFVYYYLNGEISQKINYNDQGQLHGYASYFYDHGQMRLQGWYQEGSEKGLWESYYKDGSIQTKSYYHRGKLTKELEFFSVSGQLTSKEYYTNGLVDSIVYFDQNQKMYDHVNFIRDEESYTITFKGLTYDKEVVSEYLNGIKNGVYKAFDIDGNLIADGNYLIGNQHGDWKWYTEGKLKTEATYQFNDLHGKLTRYTEDGDVDYTEFYEFGNRTGEWLNYHKNGRLSVKEYFENDELEGKKSLFNPDGNLQINLFYKRGRLIGYSYLDKSNTEIPQIEIKNQTAELVSYYPNGNKAQEFQIKNSLYEGDYVVFHENGKIRYKIEYLNGKKNGMHLVYFEDGTLKESRTYSFGDLNGAYLTYHKNGEIASSITYKTDRRHGEALYYDENNKLTKKELYYDDDIYEKETF